VNNEYVVPFIAEVAADASGQIGVLQQSAITITGVDEIFHVNLSEADSVGVLGAFIVSDLSDGDVINATGVDVSGHIKVQYTSVVGRQAAFKGALANALRSAISEHSHEYIGGLSDGTDLSQNTIAGYLGIKSYKDVIARLRADTLADFLSAADLVDYTIELDASGGALNMEEEVGADNTDADLSTTAANYRRALFTQISEGKIEQYVAPSDNAGKLYAAEHLKVMNFLPLAKGDRMVFVFDATVGEVTTRSAETAWEMPTSGAQLNRVTIDANFAPGANSTNTMAGQINQNMITDISDYSTGSLFISAPTKRRIAIKVRMTGEASTVGNFDKTEAVDDAQDAFNVVNAENTEFNPNGSEFSYIVAAGLLGETVSMKVSTGVAGDGSSKPSASTVATPAVLSVDISGMDLSGSALDGFDQDGFAIVNTGLSFMEEVTEASVANTKGVGHWLVINAAGNMNEFYYSNADKKVYYAARRDTNNAADTAELFYVTNAGRSDPIALSASTHM
jgi:hypothetical protein